MADPYEENKVRNIDSPEDLSGESGNSQPGSVLGDVGIKSPENKGAEDGNRNVKTLSGLPDVFKELGVLSDNLLLFVHHLLFLLDPSVAFYLIGRKKL
jgi:hypothetical protein